MTNRRKAIIIIVAILGAAALVAATWFAATRFQSPAQRAANAEPPAPQPVLVPITTGDLVQQTTMMGTAAHASTTTIPLPTPGEGTSVITSNGIHAGDTLTSGSVITWINDRPVFAIAGAFPLYRDLGPGDEGADVAMVQKALTDLGYGLSPDGDFGAATTQALRRFYADRNVSVPMRDKKTNDTATAPQGAATAQAGGTAGSGSTGQDKDASANAEPSSEAAPSAATPTPTPAAPRKQQEPYLPMKEFASIAALPATVDAVPTVGTTLSADNAKLSLASGSMTLSAKVPGNVAVQLSPGLHGTARWGGITIPITIAEVKDPEPSQSDNDSGQDPNQSTVTVAPVDTQLPGDWAGHNDILITLDLVDPITDALLLPQRAIATASTGATNVLLHQPDDSFTEVAVTVRACVAGTCAVDANDAAGITAGAQVRVDR